MPLLESDRGSKSEIAVCIDWVSFFVGVLLPNTLLFGPHIWAPDFWKLPTIDSSPRARLMQMRRLLPSTLAGA